MFWVKNDIFAERLKIAIQDNKVTQVILKKMSQGDMKGFIEKGKFLLF